jgi:hypothetical protein
VAYPCFPLGFSIDVEECFYEKTWALRPGVRHGIDFMDGLDFSSSLRFRRADSNPRYAIQENEDQEKRAQTQANKNNFEGAPGTT